MWQIFGISDSQNVGPLGINNQNIADRDRHIGTVTRGGFVTGFKVERMKPDGTHYWESIISRLIKEIAALPMNVQKQRIEAAFADYLGSENRRDDVSIIGFKP